MRNLIKIPFLNTKKSVSYFNPNIDDPDALKFSEHCQKNYYFLEKFIPSNATIIDIGARDGDSLMYLLPILDKDFAIIAFEPNKEEFMYLQKNMSENDLSSGEVYCHNFAIGKKTELRKFVLDTNGRNGGFKTKQSMFDFAACNWNKEIEVQSFCWNDLEDDVKRKMLEATYIKTDTEGSDIEVLTELLPVINHSRPFITMEWWPRLEKEMMDFIESINYSIVNPDKRVVIRNLDLRERCHDLFLIPSETLEGYLQK